MTDLSIKSDYRQTFGPLDLKPYQSQYLHKGRFEERWVIQSAYIHQNQVDANIYIEHPYISASDQSSFHLSVFSAQEFCTELILFWMFKKIGLASKAQEAWMRECRCRIKNPIRSYQHIKTLLIIRNFRIIGGMAYAHGFFEVTDDNNGLFLIELSGGFRCQA